MSQHHSPSRSLEQGTIDSQALADLMAPHVTSQESTIGSGAPSAGDLPSQRSLSGRRGRRGGVPFALPVSMCVARSGLWASAPQTRWVASATAVVLLLISILVAAMFDEYR
jgi:hypothetical protein